jgi:hypothetical protein
MSMIQLQVYFNKVNSLFLDNILTVNTMLICSLFALTWAPVFMSILEAL